MMMAEVAFMPKVTGSSRLIPARGPTPGRTPTIVPVRQPTKAYTRFMGARATEKPRRRLLRVSAMWGSEAEGAAGQGKPEAAIEQPEGPEGEAHGQGDRHQDVAALHRAVEEQQEQGHGDPVAQAIQGQCR